LKFNGVRYGSTGSPRTGNEDYQLKNLKNDMKINIVRIVRRLFEHIGYGVEKLDRAGYSGLVKGKLKVGEWRYLTNAEVACLKQQ